MDFEKAVSLVGTVTDLRRIASAHVIDHNQLKDEELRSALVKTKPQYAATETVKKALDELLSREPMNAADKRVPIFLVIAPDFTEDSEIEAIRYHSEHFDRNVVLITATELKSLAEEWAAPQNKNRETPLPLGLLAASGRYDRRKLGKLLA